MLISLYMLMIFGFSDISDIERQLQLFVKIRDIYRDSIPVYTHCSRDGDSLACATVGVLCYQAP